VDEMGLSFEELLIINQGDRVDSEDLLLGRKVDIWIKPVTKDIGLVFERNKVGRHELIVTQTTPQGSNVLPIRSRYPCTIYRNDVIKFESGKIVIVKSLTQLRGFSEEDILPIYDNPDEIEIGEQSNTYAMIPLLSAKEGVYPQISVTYAEGHNKNQGIYAVSQKVKENSTVTVTGDINKNDPSFPILQDIQEGLVSKLFVQVRRPIIHDNYGEGFGAIEYSAIPYCSFIDNESGFLSFSVQLQVIGKVDNYEIITGPFGTRYCPFDAIATDVYRINFVIVPEEDATNYCPQDTTGFYDFDQSPE